MSQLISTWLLALFGWKMSGSIPSHVKKAILIVAPHTTNLDFVIGKLAYMSLGIPTRFLIKKELFFFPLGILLKALGAIPVTRTKGNKTILQTVELFHTYPQFYLTITPEGTRNYTNNWKKGFYHIAQQAQVPVYMAFINYEKKRGGIGPELKISGNFDNDWPQIEDFYKQQGAKYPEKFNLSPQYQQQKINTDEGI